MKNLIEKILIKIIELWFEDYVVDYFNSKQADEQILKAWYKARRAGYSRKDMGFYYADLEQGKHTNFLGMEDNRISF